MAQDDLTLVRADPRYPGIWDTVAPYLQRAIEHGAGDWVLGDFYDAAVGERVALWALVRGGETVFGAGVTCITRYPQRAVLEVIAFGADIQTEAEWRKLLEELKNRAHATGATAIMGTGRDGWARMLKADRTRTVWELEV